MVMTSKSSSKCKRIRDAKIVYPQVIYITCPFILYYLPIYIILLAHLYYIKMASNI